MDDSEVAVLLGSKRLVASFEAWFHTLEEFEIEHDARQALTTRLATVVREVESYACLLMAVKIRPAEPAPSTPVQGE